jgi:hypothetical protein
MIHRKSPALRAVMAKNMVAGPMHRKPGMMYAMRR